MDRARATQRHAAAEFRAGETEQVAQHPQQGHVARGVDLASRAVDVELHRRRSWSRTVVARKRPRHRSHRPARFGRAWYARTMLVDRRIVLTSTLAAGGLVVACSGKNKDDDDDGEEVTPAEDLMREHGVLRRVMYVYDEAVAKLRAGGDVPMDALRNGAQMIRRVIEDYHEKIEEQLLFPRFEKAGKLVDLIATLRAQHATGRVITDQLSLIHI